MCHIRLVVYTHELHCTKQVGRIRPFRITQEVHFSHDFPDFLVSLGITRIDWQGEPLRDHCLYDFQPYILLFILCLLEVNSLEKYDSTSLILQPQFMGAPSLRYVVLVTKSSSPDRGVRRKYSQADLLAGQGEIGDIAVGRQKGRDALENLQPDVILYSKWPALTRRAYLIGEPQKRALYASHSCFRTWAFALTVMHCRLGSGIYQDTW